MPNAKGTRSALKKDGLVLAEYVVLGLVAERPVHPFAVARLVAPDGPVGRVYDIPRPIVYRSIRELVDAGLVEPERVERSSTGPQRTVMRVTARGRQRLRAWLRRPAGHVRDLRTELLIKLALLDRSGSDPLPLLVAQRQVLERIAAGLSEEMKQARGFDRTLVTWRYEAARSSVRFLDRLEREARRSANGTR